MNICTVDPGKGGAVVVIENDEPKFFYDMPMMKVKSKTMVDPVELAQIIWSHAPDKAVIEKVGASPRMGVSGAFSFGYSYGVILGVCGGLRLEYETVTPQYWKAYHGLMGKDKDAARLKVIKMFPHLKAQFKLKKSVDMADATLMGIAWLEAQKR